MWVVIFFSLVHLLCATPTPHSQQFKLQSDVAGNAVNHPKDFYDDKFKVPDPVNIIGSLQIQEGDLLSLIVECNGPPPLVYCIKYKVGHYYITDKENCETGNVTTESNSFRVEHYFPGYGQYTVVVVILQNDTAKVVASEFIDVYKTTPLKGRLVTSQDNTDRLNGFIAVNKSVHHYIVLDEKDKEFLNIYASDVTIYWYMDCCMLVNYTDNYSVNHTYTDIREYHVAAVVIANLVPPSNTNTTIEPTATFKPNAIIDNEKFTVDYDKNKELTSAKSNIMCTNNFPKKLPKRLVYGIFEAGVYVKEPINLVNITGPYHIQEEDSLSLIVEYKGSPPFVYCIKYRAGQNNITGNENCETGNVTTESNSFSLVHCFPDYGQHTVVVVIQNVISKNVSAATINVYKSLINGTLISYQDNTDRPNRFVAVNKPVHHYIKLNDKDKEFLKNNASKVTTYWFIDCDFIGFTADFYLNWTYYDTMGKHKVEAILTANLNQEPTTENIKLLKCDKIIPFGDNYTFRRYETYVNVREPINSVNITGNNQWLQHGDLLNLAVKYKGSPPFYYCVMFKRGKYKVVGNETCTEKHTNVAYSFSLERYFSDGDQHTVVVVIENEIVKQVSGINVNIYKASVQPQLSVIVVPVAFSLLAVIFVVLGIAYYQHRSRHTVEVADFDFGQNETEFKTLRQRIRDSLANIFHFRNQGDTEPLTADSGDDVGSMM